VYTYAVCTKKNSNIQSNMQYFFKNMDLYGNKREKSCYSKKKRFYLLITNFFSIYFLFVVLKVLSRLLHVKKLNVSNNYYHMNYFLGDYDDIEYILFESIQY